MLTRGLVLMIGLSRPGTLRKSTATLDLVRLFGRGGAEMSASRGRPRELRGRLRGHFPEPGARRWPDGAAVAAARDIRRRASRALVARSGGASFVSWCLL